MPKKILLAEDSLTIQKVFELTFARSDVTLTMVDNGEDAVRMVQELLPDLVIADLSLPGRTGFEVASALRSSEATKRIPVLLLSGTLVPFDEESFKRSGARGVVFKPFETQALLDKVNDLMAAPFPGDGEGKEGGSGGDEPWDFSDVLDSVEEEQAAGHVPPAPATAPPRKEEFLPGEGSFQRLDPAASVSLGDYDVHVDDLEPAPPEEPVPSLLLSQPPSGAGAEEEVEMEELDVLDQLAVLDEIDFAEEPSSTAGAPPAPPAAEAPPPAAAQPPPQSPDPLAGVFPGQEEPFLEEPFFGFESETCGMEGEAPPPSPVEEEAVPPPPPVVAPSPAEASASPVPVPAPLPAAPAAAPTPAEILQREEFSDRVREAVERAAGEAMEKVLWEWMDRLSSDFREQIRLSVEAVAWDVIPRVAETVIREEIARMAAPDDDSSPE